MSQSLHLSDSVKGYNGVAKEGSRRELSVHEVFPHHHALFPES